MIIGVYLWGEGVREGVGGGVIVSYYDYTIVT